MTLAPVKPAKVKTVNGKEAAIAISSGAPTIVGDNGVIHVIDTVMLP